MEARVPGPDWSDAAVALAGVELIVDDLDRAVALWVDVLGFELVSLGSSDVIVGELAIVTDGRLVVTLLRPASTGAGHLLSDRTPRLSQLVLTASGGDSERRFRAATEAGLSAIPTESGFYLAPEAVEGALGLEVAIVVTGHDGTPDTS